MYKSKKIGVVIPAHNEERFIIRVIDTMPAFVDKMIVVNDASTDKTAEIVMNKANNKVELINRESNDGVGAAIISGHIHALHQGMDLVAVMAGDGQMDPAILCDILDPIVEGKADYVKGNRLSSKKHRKEMPTWRTYGNIILTFLTKVASGYWNISDPQDGYTAISAETLRKLDLNKIEKGFAFENDMLVKLNVLKARVVDVQHQAIYRGQYSKIHYSRFITTTSWILFKDFVWRIYKKYFRRSIGKIQKEES